MTKLFAIFTAIYLIFRKPKNSGGLKIQSDNRSWWDKVSDEIKGAWERLTNW